MSKPPQKRELRKVWLKNDEPRINHYTLFILCLNFDGLLTPHKKFLWDFIKNGSVERSIMKCGKTFTNKANITNHVLYSLFIVCGFFSHIVCTAPLSQKFVSQYFSKMCYHARMNVPSRLYHTMKQKWSNSIKLCCKTSGKRHISIIL